MAFKETASKGKKKMRNRERLSLLGDGHKTGSGTQGAKQGNQWFPGTLDQHYKRGGGGGSNRRKQQNHQEKNSVKKIKENREYLLVSQKQPL